MEWNAENVLDALNDFERKSEIPEILDQYLERIAKNGEIVFPWGKLKPLLKKKLEVVLDEFYETCPVETSVPVPNFETFNFDTLKKTILQAVDAFTSAPFTIQRLCELVTNPTKHYNRTDKYMRGIEKNVLVVSTIEPRSAAQGDGNNANNPVVNGMLNDSPRDDNDTLNGHESTDTDSVSSSNLNTPSNHVLLENFANVFPSAACIPPSSICIKREIDNNFLADSECVENQEPQFDSAPPVEQIETADSKEEEMDTTEDEHEQPITSADNTEITSGDAVSIEDSDVTEPAKLSDSETSDSPLESDLEPASSESSDSVSASDSVKIEADCSELNGEAPVVPISDSETVKPAKCEQDDEVSQSDDNSPDATEVSQSDAVSNITEASDIVEASTDIAADSVVDASENVVVASDNAEASRNDDASAEVVGDVSESIITCESSEQCMEVEPSTSSSDPDPPI